MTDKSAKTEAEMMAYLKARREAIGKQRDMMRNVIDEYEALFESTGRGLEALDEAIDAISELA